MFVLGIFGNGFPAEYHPDEPAKVAQLLTGARDYHHPPLMLTLVDAVAQAGGIAREPATLVRVGRTLSAAYLAGTMALLVWLSAIYGRTRAAVVTAAAALGLDAQAVLAAHFFKEDALFVFGLALTFVAGAVHWRRRGAWDRLALGASAGLALSAKYVGVLAVVYALVLATLAASERQRWRNLGGCALGVLLVVGLCNGAAWWAHGAEVLAGWRLGAATVGTGNEGIGARVPNFQYIKMLLGWTPLPCLAGAAVFWTGLRRFPFRTHADRWLAGLSPLWLTAVFSFSASTAARYFLPVSLMMGCVAGAALPEAVRWMKRPVNATWAAALVAFFALLGNVPSVLPGTLSLLAGFAGDDRAELSAWITTHLPPHAVLAEDTRAHLPLEGHALRVLSAPVVADLGDLAALRAQGVGYVVVCWYDSRRYTDPRKYASPDARDFGRRQAFYQGLSSHAHSLWKSPLRQPYPLCPGLELFALDP